MTTVVVRYKEKILFKQKEMECGICINRFNQSSRKKIQCAFCNSTTCSTCVKTYVLTKQDDPRCMHCHRVWNREFIDMSLPYHFRDTVYKKHRQNVLFQREELFFPDTLSKMEMNQEQRSLLKEHWKKQRLEYQALKKMLNDVANRIRTIDIAISHLASNPLSLIDNIENIHIPERRSYIKKCIRTCNGFINNKGHCPICDVQICMRCHEEKHKEEPHVCKEEDVASIRTIHQQTKACPKCAVPIQKISGCNQMWCTLCKTAFDWDTGRVISGRIHNPHYYEWLTNDTDGNEAVNNACANVDADDIQNGLNLRRKLRDLNISKDAVKLTLSALRLTHHVHIVVMPQYIIQNDDLYDFERNSQFRIEYLKGNIDIEKFKQNLQQKEKLLEKKRSFYQLFDVFIQASTGFFQDIIQGDEDTFQKTAHQLERLRTYVNEHFEILQKRFHCRVYRISADFQIHKI